MDRRHGQDRAHAQRGHYKLQGVLYALRGSHRFQCYVPEIDCINDSEVALHMVSEEVSAGRSVPQVLKVVMPKLKGMVILGVMDAEQLRP